MTSKPTNPKDAVGIAKVPFSVIPWGVIANVGLALMEGARKYGRHNYRAVGVRASVYFDATFRHVSAWWEGRDIDPDSGLHEIDKAIASLVVLRDSIMTGNWVDDRPPATLVANWQKHANQHAEVLIARYPDEEEPWTEARVQAMVRDQEKPKEFSRDSN